MSEEQEKAYEEAKAYYRNLILQSIDSDGISKSQLVVLQGLTKLRQLANHPLMVNPEYAHDSGKFEDVLYKMQTVISEDHKILIFSQYIKHLDLIRGLSGRKRNYRTLIWMVLHAIVRSRSKHFRTTKH